MSTLKRIDVFVSRNMIFQETENKEIPSYHVVVGTVVVDVSDRQTVFESCSSMQDFSENHDTVYDAPAVLRLNAADRISDTLEL